MNCYDTLEVSPNASQEVIRAAYKSLMQRHHPDKNPGSAEAADHASKVVQAYEVLSDPARRAVYDTELKAQSQARLNVAREYGAGIQASPIHARRSATKTSKSSWLVWLIILVILLSGWAILSLSHKKSSGPKRVDEAVRGQSDTTARTATIFDSKLTVSLKASEKQPEEHTLSIPLLVVRVGTFDAVQASQYLDQQKDLIRQKLAEKLASAQYEDLIKMDGEQHLKKIILEAIEDITGTSHLKEYPSSGTESPGRYGVIAVMLPESFSLK
jgi:curved DNA-binding protein CbpA